MKTCERCGSDADKLYSVSQENDFSEVITKEVCWSCDHDVINGGDLFEDSWDILADRKETDYAFDPINNAPP